MAVTLTTVNSCQQLLESYVQNFLRYGHDDVCFVIIGDKKTPQRVRREAETVHRRGFHCEYWDIYRQRRWLKRFPQLAGRIPYNSDNRRNLGYLRAAELGCEIIVSIDDDNFAVPDEDFYRYHSVAGTKRSIRKISSSVSWFNPCSLLKLQSEEPIYMRGFPVSQRFMDDEEDFRETRDSGYIVVNMGLWLGDPDVDAVTNLAQRTKVMHLKGGQRMLGRYTLAPINSQNTAFHRSILPCYYFPVLDVRIGSLRLDRFADIWQGLFAKTIIDHLNHRVTVGHPLTAHIRNKHDPVEDLKKELLAMSINERLAEWLTELDLRSDNYSDAYLELGEELSKNSRIFGNRPIQTYFRQLCKVMHEWVDVCDEVL